VINDWMISKMQKSTKITHKKEILKIEKKEKAF
jgi:hypothetical protein